MAYFTIGDIVQLKSGGPKMTVLAVDDPHAGNWVMCQWFVGGKLNQGSFKPESLVRVDDK